MSTQATERMELRKELMKARDYCLAIVDGKDPRHQPALACEVYLSMDAINATHANSYSLRQRWLWCARELDRRISNLFRNKADQIGGFDGNIDAYEHDVNASKPVVLTADQIRAGVAKLMAGEPTDEPPRATKKPSSKCQYCGDFRPHVHVFAGDFLPPEEEAAFHESASTSDRLDIERARLESLRNACKRVLQMRDRGAFAKPEEQQLWRDFEAEVMR